jgi:hypothetical protein
MFKWIIKSLGYWKPMPDYYRERMAQLIIFMCREDPECQRVMKEFKEKYALS